MRTPYPHDDEELRAAHQVEAEGRHSETMAILARSRCSRGQTLSEDMIHRLEEENLK